MAAFSFKEVMNLGTGGGSGGLPDWLDKCRRG
jgi:hypothetical protein